MAAEGKEEKRESIMEDAVVSAFIGNHENTMNSVVSNSVGMALLGLKKRYFRKMTEEEEMTEEEVEAHCEKFLEKFDKVAESKEAKASTPNPAIKNMIRLAREPSSSLDNVTLYLAKSDSPAVSMASSPPQTGEKPEEKGREFFKDRYVFPLKQVLVLVWAALHDKAQFPESADKEKDHYHRLESFWNCLKKLQEIPVCHHGTRNELVFLLNGTYKGINLIEDATSTILSFLKAEINKLFWDAYAKTTLPDKKRALTLAMFEWMEQSNPAAILREIGSGEKHIALLRSSLAELFIQHGTDPRTIRLDHQIDGMLESLDFSYDAEHYPILAKVNEILNVPEERGQSERNIALAKIKAWIKATFDLENETHRAQLSDFHLLYQAYTTLNQNKFLLSVTGGLERFNILLETCTAYFNASSEIATFPPVSPETRSAIEELTLAVNRSRKEELIPQIESFFAQWYAVLESAFSIIDILRVRWPLYDLLYHEATRAKITLDDDVLEKFLPSDLPAESKEARDAENNRPPYQINRIFLHAILTKPCNWTPRFAGALQRVLSSVNKLGPTGAGIGGALRSDSYPPQLMAQLDYLIQIYEGHLDALRPGEEMILLPEHVKTADEWIAVFYLLTKEAREREYDLCGIGLNKNIFDSIKTIAQLDDFLGTIPEASRHVFLAALGIERVRELISNGYQLAGILRELPETDKKITFLTTLGIERVHELVSDNSQWASILMGILEHDQKVTFLAALGLGIEQIDELIADSSPLVRGLREISEADRDLYLAILGIEQVRKMIQDGNQLTKVLECLPEASRYKYLTMLGSDWLCGIIRGGSQLEAVHKSLPEASGAALEIEQVDKLVSDSSQLALILSEIPEPNKKITFLATLRIERVRELISNGYQLAGILRELPETSINTFLTTLGIERVRELISNSSQLANILRELPEASRDTFLADLGIERVRELISDGWDLALILSILKETPEASTNTFLTTLGIERVRGLISNGNYLSLILGAIPEASQNTFLADLGVERVHELISNGSDLARILRAIPEASRDTFLADLGIERMRELISDSFDLALILQILQETPEASTNTFLTTLLTALGIERVRELISEGCQEDLIHGYQLGLILRAIPEASKNTLLAALGIEQVHKIIQDGNQLANVLECLPEASRYEYLTILGSDWACGIISGESQLEAVQKSLPEASRATFRAAFLSAKTAALGGAEVAESKAELASSSSPASPLLAPCESSPAISRVAETKASPDQHPETAIPEDLALRILIARRQAVERLKTELVQDLADFPVTSVSGSSPIMTRSRSDIIKEIQQCEERIKALETQIDSLTKLEEGNKGYVIA